MSETDFIISIRPYQEGVEIPEEIKQIEEWDFNCDRPLVNETSESNFMLSWVVQSTDNRYIYQGQIREGYIYQSLSENNNPNLQMTTSFIRNKLIEEENFLNTCVFRPNNRRSIPSLFNIPGLGSQAGMNLLLGLLNRNGSLLNSPLDSVLNESFIQELERSINQKKPTSKETIEKLEILTVDDNLLKQYINEDSNIKDEAKSQLQKDSDKKDITDEEIYKKVLSDWRSRQSNGIRCAMCLEFVKLGDKVVRLPCTDKDGNKTPHYFHYVEDNGKGEPKNDTCVGFGIMEWLKEQNTCPCCRFELPVEKENEPLKEDPENSSNNEMDSQDNQNLENINTANPRFVAPDEAEIAVNGNINNNTYQEELLRSILGLVANNSQQPNPQPCQCARCLERRREEERIANMTESERVEEQLLREALRRSENISGEEGDELDRTHEGMDGNYMTEEEAIEAAIRASLQGNE